jgi:hypothetical protein
MSVLWSVDQSYLFRVHHGFHKEESAGALGLHIFCNWAIMPTVT